MVKMVTALSAVHKDGKMETLLKISQVKYDGYNSGRDAKLKL